MGQLNENEMTKIHSAQASHLILPRVRAVSPWWRPTATKGKNPSVGKIASDGEDGDLVRMVRIAGMLLMIMMTTNCNCYTPPPPSPFIVKIVLQQVLLIIIDVPLPCMLLQSSGNLHATMGTIFGKSDRYQCQGMMTYH